MTSKREHVDGKGKVEDGESINGDGRDKEMRREVHLREDGKGGMW